MRVATIVQALAADLEALGALGDERTAEVARRLATAMEGPITARMLEAMGEIAAELGSSLPGGRRAEVRLSGGEVELAVVEEARVDEPELEEADADTSARITLRLPAQLKSRIEAASAREAVSVNTYIVRVLGERSRAERGPRVGRRLSGYGQS